MSYKLICFDMDGVIFKDINFWMSLHKEFGTLEQGKELTAKFLHTDNDRLDEEVVPPGDLLDVLDLPLQRGVGIL